MSDSIPARLSNGRVIPVSGHFDEGMIVEYGGTRYRLIERIGDGDPEYELEPVDP
jgi:hypothetical protein